MGNLVRIINDIGRVYAGIIFWVNLFYPVKKNPGSGPSVLPCYRALDVVGLFTLLVECDCMHNLFLRGVVNGMAYVHVMCAIRM
jgi:hypothetical protein